MISDLDATWIALLSIGVTAVDELETNLQHLVDNQFGGVGEKTDIIVVRQRCMGLWNQRAMFSISIGNDVGGHPCPFRDGCIHWTLAFVRGFGLAL